MRRARGFTLMEAALSLALVGVIAVAATTLYGTVIRSFTNARKTASLAERTQAAIEYMLHELRGVGGNGIPASAALFVEDGCGVRGQYPDCAGNDRVTTFTALPRIYPCTIEAALPGDQYRMKRSVDYDADGTLDCCFNDLTNNFRRHVMLLKDQQFFRPVLMASTAANSCVFQAVSDDVLPQMRRLDPGNFVGGSAVVVEFKTFYVDPAPGTHALWQHVEMDPNNGGTAPTVAGDRLFLLDHVYDFQVSLGYDVSEPADGRVAVTIDGVGDEWLYNAPGETLLTDAPSTPTAAVSVDTSAPGFDIRRLQLARAEIILGVPTDGIGAGGPLFSPARGATIAVPNVALRGMGTVFMPRNSDEFSLGGP